MTTWFITGASRGIGRELAEQALVRGDRVAATLRRPEQLDDLASEYGDKLWRRRLDVTDAGQIEEVVGAAFAEHDRIDVVVSNAGLGVFGTCEDLTDTQVEQVIATNLTGSIQLARRVVPHLRKQGGVKSADVVCDDYRVIFSSGQALSAGIGSVGVTSSLLTPSAGSVSGAGVMRARARTSSPR